MKKNQPLLVISEGNNVKDVFDLAYAYNRSGKLIDEQIAKSEDYGLIFPSVVCQSFAVELFLKFFIYLDKSKNDLKIDFCKDVNLGHKFTKLWDKIDDKFKKHICVHYSNATEIATSPVMFGSLLTDVDENAFANWRYPFEREEFKFMHGEEIKLISNVLLSASHKALIELKND